MFLSCLLLLWLFIVVFAAVCVLHVYIIVVKSCFLGQPFKAGRPSSRHLLFWDDPSNFCMLWFWDAHDGSIHCHVVWAAWRGNKNLEHDHGF